MDQYNNDERMDQADRIKEIENLPEVQNMFDEIDKLQGRIPEKREEPEQEEIKVEESQIPENSETEDDNQYPEHEQEFDHDDIDEEEVKPLPGKRSSKFRKLYNDRYRARIEKEEALKRVAELEAMLEESLSTGTYHYGKSVYAEQDKAKQDAKKAFDEGNIDAYLEAQIALTKATNAVHDLERWANESEAKRNSFSNQRSNYSNQEYDNQAIQQDIVNDWLDTHPYLKINSKNFDPTMYGNVTSFISRLENNLQKNDATDVIGSEEYFDTIDDYIKSIKAPKRDSARNREYLANASGVRKVSTSGNSKSSLPDNQVTLNTDEKELAERLGYSNQEYLKFKIYRMQNPDNIYNGYNKYGK